MKTIEISLVVENEDIGCYGRDDFEVTYDGDYDRPIVDSLYFKGKDVSHLIDERFDCICEEILQDYIAEQEYLGEQQMELERGN